MERLAQAIENESKVKDIHDQYSREFSDKERHAKEHSSEMKHIFQQEN